MRLIHKGATSQSIYLSVKDSASTTGGMKTAIAWNTAGIIASYTRNGAARTAITLATLASASAAWSSGGFVEVDATNEPGLYRLDVPDAAFASGADSVVVEVGGAAGMVWTPDEIQLTAVDLQDAVAAGLSRIDAAITSRMATFALPANFSSMVINASGRIDVGTWLGSAVNVLIGGRVDANAQVVGDKTGYTASTVSDKTGYTLSAAGVQAVWDAATSALSTVGSVGKLLVDNINATISSRLASASYTAPPTTTQIWDEGIPGSHAAGTAAAKLNSASAAGDPLGTAVPGAYGAGTAGYDIGHLADIVWGALAATYNAAGTLGQKLNAAGGAAGSGSLTCTINTVNASKGNAPEPGVFVYATSDVGGASTVASGLSDAAGNVVFFLNPGTYYIFRVKSGMNFSNPQTFVAS